MNPNPVYPPGAALRRCRYRGPAARRLRARRLCARGLPRARAGAARSDALLPDGAQRRADRLGPHDADQGRRAEWTRGMLLGPLVVEPAHKGQGYGKALMRLAMEEARKAGCPFVILVGDQPYYWPFGFRPLAARKGADAGAGRPGAAAGGGAAARRGEGARGNGQGRARPVHVRWTRALTSPRGSRRRRASRSRQTPRRAPPPPRSSARTRCRLRAGRRSDSPQSSRRAARPCRGAARLRCCR